MGSRTAALAVATLLSLAPLHVRAAEEVSAKPLPVDHTTILPSGGVFFVEGRVRIPKGIEITVQKDTKLVGRGKDATIEIEGELKIHGVADSKVLMENITIEVQPKFGEVRLDMVKVSGASRGVVSPKGRSVDGRIMVMNAEFEGAAGLDVTMIANEVDLQRVYVRAPVRVKAVDPEGSPRNSVKLNLLNCCSGPSSIEPGALMGGVLVEGVHEVIVRACRIGGDKAKFTDCDEVAFDGNQVKCASVEFSQSAAGRFGKTSITKCDVLCEKISLWAPAAPGRTEIVLVDKCWFGGEMDEKAVRTRFFRDKDDDDKCGVRVDVTKIMERPLLIAGKLPK
jgi:hypothetical protein